MLKRFCLIFVFAALVSLALLPLHAQDAASCSFEPNPAANVFESLAQVEALGIKADDLNALAKAAQDPKVDATQFLISQGYDESKLNDILSDPNNVSLVNQLVHPSPSRDILDRAYALLNSYGLPSGALIDLYKLTSDRQALYDNVIARGLSPEQADGFADAALALADEAKQIGVFDYAATLDGQDVLDRAGYDRVSLFSVGNDLDDPVALRAALIDQGVSEADADAMTADLQALHDDLGLTEDYMSGWETTTAVYTMDYYGIPAEEILTLAEQGDPESLSDCLSAAGFDASAIDIAMSELSNYFIGDDGDEPILDADEIAQVALADAGELGAEWGLDGAALADLSQYDDPDALREALMNDYGLSAEDADRFADEFDNSLFGSVFSDLDDSALDLLDQSISAAENGEEFTLPEDFSVDSVTSDSGDDQGDDQSSDDQSGDDTGGDDTGGDDTGGDDTGGEVTTPDDQGGDQGGDTGGDDQSGDVSTPEDQGGDDQNGETGSSDQGSGDQGGGESGEGSGG